MLKVQNNIAFKKESFLRQLLNVSLGTVITLFIGFLTTPIITRITTTSDYGRYSLFTTICSIYVMFVCLGLDQGYIRYYYKNDSAEYRRALLSMCVQLSLFFLIIFSYMGFFITSRMIKIDGLRFYLIFLVATISITLNRYSLLVCRMNNNTKIFSLLNILCKSLYVMISLGAYFALKEIDKYTLIIAYSAGYLIVSTVGVFLCKGEWELIALKKAFKSLPAKEILFYSIPLLISSGVFNMFQAIDKLCINHFLNYSDVGVYSSAQSLMAIFSVVQMSFNIVWAPQSMKHYEEKPDDKKYFLKIYEIVTVVMLFFGIIVLVFKDIYILFLGDAYREAAFVLPFLILNPVMYTISETTVNGLYFKNKSKWVVLTVVLVCFVNLIGNMVFIPTIGIRGAALSTGISYVLFFGLRTSFSNIFYKIDFREWRLYLLLIGYFFLAMYSSYHTTDIVVVLGGFAVLIVASFLYKNTIKIFLKNIQKGNIV